MNFYPDGDNEGGDPLVPAMAGIEASTLPYESDVLTSEGDRSMYAAPLGKWDTAVNGLEVPVFADTLVRNPGIEGQDHRTWYDGVGFELSDRLPFLEVNTTTGSVQIVNASLQDFEFSYYEITSAMGSLDADAWSSFDDQNMDAVDGDDAGATAGDSLLEGWDEDGNTGPGILNENFFLGTSSVGDTPLSLGAAYDATVGAEDLVFRIGNVETGEIEEAMVTYVSTPGVSSDFNGDGVVNAIDYALWRDNLGATEDDGVLSGNETDGVVDSADYDLWRSNYGVASGATTAGAPLTTAPEPTASLLAILGLFGLCGVRNRNEGLASA